MGISNSWYGTKSILNGDIDAVRDYTNRMDVGEVELIQGVSQITSHVAFPLKADDFMQTQRMTIEELIESPYLCCGSVLATVCEIETGMRGIIRRHVLIVHQGFLFWTDNYGVKNAGITKLPFQGKLFKVHVVVMDNSGSTTFVLFDRIVSQFLGRNVGDLIVEFNQEIGSDSYPPDLNMFLDKKMLFKVEVSKGNVRKWFKNYTVKRATDDAAIIQNFISLHNIKVILILCPSDEEEEAEYNNALIELADNSPI
ncbi:replication factor A protein, partial [Trifolium medium]|nr:replication factor A protein [Trifolium medium]